MEDKIINFITKKEHRKYTILISLLTVFILLNEYTIIRFTDIKVKDEEDNIRQITFPFTKESTQNQVYIFSGKMYCSNLSQKIVNIVPDDVVASMKINNISVSLDKIDKKSFTGYINGFDIDIGPYIHAGENTFQIKLLDYGGIVALDISNSSRDKLYVFIHIVILILLTILLYYFFNFFRFKRKLLFQFWKQIWQ